MNERQSIAANRTSLGAFARSIARITSTRAFAIASMSLTMAIARADVDVRAWAIRRARGGEKQSGRRAASRRGASRRASRRANATRNGNGNAIGNGKWNADANAKAREQTNGTNGTKGNGEEENDEQSWFARATADCERRVNGALIGVAVSAIDGLYTGRSYARFHALETVARVPYFSFMSVLHMYETFGWWRKADYLKVHFAETMNEYHHLLIMESLGGASRWSDRFVAQHIAVAYFWICVGQYLISPRWAYNLLEQVESHAYATYDGFLNANEEALKAQPAPRVAVQYYTKGDLYLFDEFQTGDVRGERRPKIANLYDVFVNVRNDEGEHMKTMEFCQRPGNGLRSPSSREAKVLLSIEACALEDEECEEKLEASLGERSCEGLVDCVINFGTGAVETQAMKQ